jgi:TolB-like protein
MGRLFEQLKRRNVLRPAAGYAVVAWLIIEVADTVFPILGVPTWVTTMVVVLIIIGFPITVVVSWVYQWTPAGIMTEQQADAAGYTQPVGIGRQIDFVIIVLLVIAVGWLVYDKTIVAPVLENSIAVLPFVNMSDDPGNEYFSDGMSEEILNLLARIRGLKVIGRTSSFSFKGQNEDLRVIGQTLGVKTVLEGSVRKSGDRVRITAQLVDVSDGTHIWSETYDRTMTDIFAVQDNVAAAIIEALQIHVGTIPTRGRPTENPEAYTLFLRARASLNDLEYWNAEEILLEAIELDPNFAEAYELLVATYVGLAGWGIEAAEAQELIRDVATKAISLDPDRVFAEVWYHGTQLGPEYRVGTLEALDRATRTEPDNPLILESYIFLLTEIGYLEEALRWAEHYVQVDPLSLLANMNWAVALYAVGRTEDAMAALEFANRSNLDPGSTKWNVDGINLFEGHDEIAIEHFESWLVQRDYPDPRWFRDLVTAARDPQLGQAYLDERIPEILATIPEDDAFNWHEDIISLYLFFGFLDRHYELVMATEPTDATWHYAGIHVWRGVIFRRLGFTGHPDFVELARLLSIDNVWEKRGPPDFCEKVGSKWVCE